MHGLFGLWTFGKVLLENFLPYNKYIGMFNSIVLVLSLVTFHVILLHSGKNYFFFLTDLNLVEFFFR